MFEKDSRDREVPDATIRKPLEVVGCRLRLKNYNTQKMMRRDEPRAN